ncbi:GNAT family N-acetyltransferase [Streptomyces fulvorobeus]|uniref:GNAT family N-acetyltransferase n=1 Tax=Streptomyces fulvorobeus TaxID=284028 RepID=A0A7J0C5F3_9ACTN|nr:GNAT family N-acetyltransferase [Streptomyces fulvorobeus]NYE41353.1 GNAT superfamily N-acetyltransferase [Streptomyces fulvorobeus]GFM97700.1 GNAT family N-acetyltransferase [Streptomyces fulvorobeus]
MTDSTPELRFIPLSADDDDTAGQWLQLMAEAADDVPGSAPPCPVDMIGSLRFAPPATALEDWVALREGQVVGALRTALPNGAPVARVDQLLVHPKLRRRGIGRALFGKARELAAGHGRTVLAGMTVEPLEGGPARDPAPSAFVASLGGVAADGPSGLHQWLDLRRHNPLADGVPALPEGYGLVRWGTVTPDAYAVPVSLLEQSLGAAGAEPEPDQEVETSYARAFETMRVGRGRRAYHTGVVHRASGTLAGYTSISKTTGNPEYALQGMTVVHRAHRGHRLGLLLKLSNLENVLRQEPAVRLLETANAEDNHSMIAVNSAMGFVPQDRWVSWTFPTGPSA